MTPREYRPLVTALYPAGFLFLAGALSEPLLQILPMRLGQAQWRFGAVGLMSGAVQGAIFALMVLMGAAALLEHRRVLRAGAVVCTAAAAVIAVVALLFILDFLQMRAVVNPAVKSTLDMTVLRVLMVLGLSTLAALALGIGAWRSSRVAGGARAKEATKGASLVFTPQQQAGRPA